MSFWRTQYIYSPSLSLSLSLTQELELGTWVNVLLVRNEKHELGYHR